MSGFTQLLVIVLLFVIAMTLGYIGRMTITITIKKKRMKTDMFGLRRWIDAHPRKNLSGFFTVNGRPLTHNEVIAVVNHCVKKGYRTEEELPEKELSDLLNGGMSNA